jgi:hypothetical protein
MQAKEKGCPIDFSIGQPLFVFLILFIKKQLSSYDYLFTQSPVAFETRTI